VTTHGGRVPDKREAKRFEDGGKKVEGKVGERPAIPFFSIRKAEVRRLSGKKGKPQRGLKMVTKKGEGRSTKKLSVFQDDVEPAKKIRAILANNQGRWGEKRGGSQKRMATNKKNWKEGGTRDRRAKKR